MTVTGCKAEWPMVKLGEVADFQNGFAFKPSDWGEEGKPIIRIQNLTKSSKNINRTTVEVDPKYHVERGDLLISWSATIGVFLWEGEPALLNQHIFLVKPNDKILKKYLYFLGLTIKENIEQLVHGTTMTHITKGKFLDIKIPLPSFEEQRRIVAKLEAVFAEIDKAMAASKAQADNFSALKSRFIASKFSTQIAAEWPTVALGDITLGKPQYGSGARKVLYDGKVRYVRITDITDNGELKPNGVVSPSVVEPDLFLKPGNFLVARSGSVGRTYIHKDLPGIYQYAGYLIRFRINPDKAIPEYIYYITKSKSWGEWILSNSKTVTLTNINAKQYSSFQFPLPPLETQQTLVAEIDTMFAEIDKAMAVSKAQTENHSALKSSILSQELQGRAV